MPLFGFGPDMVSPSSTSWTGRDDLGSRRGLDLHRPYRTVSVAPPQDARMSGGVSLVSVVSPAFLVTVNSISRAGSKIWRRRGPRVGTPLRCTGVSTSVSRHSHFSQADMVCQVPSHRYASCYFSSQSRNGWYLGSTFTSWHFALSWNISQGGRHCVCLEDAITAEDPKASLSGRHVSLSTRFDPG